MKNFKNATFYMILILALSSSAAFGLGRLSVLLEGKEPIQIEEALPLRSETELRGTSLEVQSEAKPSDVPTKIETPPPVVMFVASRSGKSYYFPWCGIVKRIKEENKVTFSSKEEAEKAGYKPGNCAGMK